MYALVTTIEKTLTLKWSCDRLVVPSTKPQTHGNGQWCSTAAAPSWRRALVKQAAANVFKRWCSCCTGTLRLNWWLHLALTHLVQKYLLHLPNCLGMLVCFLPVPLEDQELTQVQVYHSFQIETMIYTGLRLARSNRFPCLARLSACSASSSERKAVSTGTVGRVLTRPLFRRRNMNIQLQVRSLRASEVSFIKNLILRIFSVSFLVSEVSPRTSRTWSFRTSS